MLTTIDKALVPVLVTLVLAAAGWVGITGNMNVTDAITLLITAGLVWLVPNKKA